MKRYRGHRNEPGAMIIDDYVASTPRPCVSQVQSKAHRCPPLPFPLPRPPSTPPCTPMILFRKRRFHRMPPVQDALEPPAGQSPGGLWHTTNEPSKKHPPGKRGFADALGETHKKQRNVQKHPRGKRVFPDALGETQGQEGQE